MINNRNINFTDLADTLRQHNYNRIDKKSNEGNLSIFFTLPTKSYSKVTPDSSVRVFLMISNVIGWLA